MSKIFFSADHHWGHAKIIELCNRPFDDVADMDVQMESFWNNEAVTRNDTVFYLGDLALSKKYISVLNKLEFNIFYWLPGNHDLINQTGTLSLKGIKGKLAPFHNIEVVTYSEFSCMPRKLGKRYIVLCPPLFCLCLPDLPLISLCHYPLHSWPNSKNGGIHLHGHTHGTLKKQNRRIDVGVDACNFKPISLEEVLELAK